MPRPVVRALTGVLALTAAAVVTPLAAPLPAAADSVVVGGQPAPVADSPWAVALSSRDRFGGARSGQFCGGVVVAPTKVLTVAHCLGEEALGGPVSRVRDLRVIAGRERLSETTGQEIPVRGVWVNPAYDPDTNAGDLAVLTLARALPRSSVIPMARTGDEAYRAGTGAAVYGWGDTTGAGTYASVLRSARVQVLPDAECARAYPGGREGCLLYTSDR
ncbi:serine protease, partial [Streptomyces sp. WAC04770]